MSIARNISTSCAAMLFLAVAQASDSDLGDGEIILSHPQTLYFLLDAQSGGLSAPVILSEPPRESAYVSLAYEEAAGSVSLRVLNKSAKSLTYKMHSCPLPEEKCTDDSTVKVDANGNSIFSSTRPAKLFSFVVSDMILK